MSYDEDSHAKDVGSTSRGLSFIPAQTRVLFAQTQQTRPAGRALQPDFLLFLLPTFRIANCQGATGHFPEFIS
jgi:hypothetical protein